MVETTKQVIEYYGCEFTMQQALDAIQQVHGIEIKPDAGIAIYDSCREPRYHISGKDIVSVTWRETT